MLDLQKKRVQMAVLVVALIVLSFAAEKSRELVGEEAASKSGQVTLLNCLDMGSGSLACGVREGVKLYVYSLRNKHVKTIRQQATERAITEALTGGMTASAAAKHAQNAGSKAAKLASREAKRVVGPIISSGWEFFEAIYYQGTVAEGLCRGMGTLFGTYLGGFHGEEKLGRFGYFAGSHLGSWFGGRIGLMIYDVINGLNYLINFIQPEEEITASSENEDPQAYNEKEEMNIDEDSLEHAEFDQDSSNEKEEMTVVENSLERSEYYEDSYKEEKDLTAFGDSLERSETNQDSYVENEEITVVGDSSESNEYIEQEEVTVIEKSYKSRNYDQDSYTEKEETIIYDESSEPSENYRNAYNEEEMKLIETSSEEDEVSESWGLF